MYGNNKYEEGYKFYLNYLEQSEDINYLDTVAQIYNDTGDHKKAIEVYEKRILPWVVLENDEVKEQYKNKYEILKKYAETAKTNKEKKK